MEPLPEAGVFKLKGRKVPSVSRSLRKPLRVQEVSCFKSQGELGPKRGLSADLRPSFVEQINDQNICDCAAGLS